MNHLKKNLIPSLLFCRILEKLRAFFLSPVAQDFKGFSGCIAPLIQVLSHHMLAADSICLRILCKLQIL